MRVNSIECQYHDFVKIQFSPARELDFHCGAVAISFRILQEFVWRMQLKKRYAPEAISDRFWNLCGALGDLLGPLGGRCGASWGLLGASC